MNVGTLLEIERAQTAGIIGGLSGLLAATIVTVLEFGSSSVEQGVLVGIGTALFFVVITVVLNISRPSAA